MCDCLEIELTNNVNLACEEHSNSTLNCTAGSVSLGQKLFFSFGKGSRITDKKYRQILRSL